MRPVALCSALLLSLTSLIAHAQAPAAPARIVSPEIAADQRVTIRIPAPNATPVALQSAGDMPQVPFGGGLPMTKNADGVWEVSVALDPGAYRYNFSVDGVRVLDPNSPKVSESNDNAHSWLHVDGAAWMDANGVPHGHPGPFSMGPDELPLDIFAREFNADIKPYVQAHYPVLTDRAHTAIAGLSMGDAQTLDIAFGDLASYGYIGVYSSGFFGVTESDAWERAHLVALDDAALKNGLELVWFSTGTEDFPIETTRATVAMMEQHGFGVDYTESGGGHTWINWREYLRTFAPQLFK